MAQPATSLADGRSGKIAFQSITPSGLRALVRREASPAVTITGTLRIPGKAAGKLPAMVIAHGSGGVNETRELAWAERLSEIGVAAFVVDSFGPRNIRDTTRDQAQLSTAANTADALAALRILATHPRIDARRIGVMGFSRGGGVAAHTALEPIRKGVIDDDLRFAAHIPLYPACGTRYVAERATGAPMLFLLGELDDYTPIQPCLRYVEWFKSKGVDAAAIVYPGAHHGFDGAARVQFMPGFQTGRGCNAEVSVDTLQTRRLDTGAVLKPPEVQAYFRECSSTGATVGANSAARGKANADVQAFLKKVFGL